MKKRKYGRLFIVATALLTAFLFVFSGCTRENKKADAKRIASDEFAVEEILVVSAGSSASTVASAPVARYLFYVLGVKEDKEILLIVPALKGEKSYIVDWVFHTPFRQIINQLNSLERERSAAKRITKGSSFLIV